MSKKDFDSIDFDADFLSDVSLERLKKDKTENHSKPKVNAKLMTDVEAVVYEGQGIAEDNSYESGNDDVVNTDFLEDFTGDQDNDIVEDDKELQDKLSKELEEKIKSQSAEKTLYAPSNKNFMNSIYEEADQASEDFVNDLISTMPTVEEYDMQSHEYENDEEYVERTDTINHVKRTDKVSFVSALSKLFANIFNFKGFASKSEYWFSVAWIIIFNALAAATNLIGVGWIMSTFIFVAFFIPYMSVTTRRFNDAGLNSSTTIISTLFQCIGVFGPILTNLMLNITLLNNKLFLFESLNVNMPLVFILYSIACLFGIIISILTIVFALSKEKAYIGKTIQMSFYLIFSIGFGIMSMASSMFIILPLLGII